MAAFLTQQWAEDVVAALNGSDRVRSAVTGVDITIQQVVTGGPSGEVRYWTKLAGGSVEVAIGEAPDADITMTQDYETAIELNRGELVPQAAFMQAKLKVVGNMGKMLRSQDAVAALAPVIASVPAEY